MSACIEQSQFPSLDCCTQYVYHRVPTAMVGNDLYPLNSMEGEDLISSLKENSAKKYSWRKDLMNGVLPILDCLWNDVIHTCPYHPKELYKAQIAAGLSPPENDRYFEIPLSRFSHIPTVVYMYEKVPNEIPICLIEAPIRGLVFLNESGGCVHAFSQDFSMPIGSNDYFADNTQYQLLTGSLLDSIKTDGIPSTTTDYYHECSKRGGLPMTFFHVPHVLIQGSINVEGLRTVAWNEV